MSVTDIKRIKQVRNSPDYKFKVCLIGDSNCGKTCLMRRIVDDIFEEEYKPSLVGDCSYLYYSLKLNNKPKTAAIMLWDTAGEEKFQSVTKAYFSKTNAVITMYDITSQKSFERVSFWIELANEYVNDDCIIFVVGTKSDLDSCRVVDFDLSKNMIEKKLINAKSISEVSSKSGHGVAELFIKLTKNLVEENELGSVISSYVDVERGSYKLSMKMIENKDPDSCNC